MIANGHSHQNAQMDRILFFILIFLFFIPNFVRSEWEIPDEFRPPALFTSINPGLFSPISSVGRSDSVLEQWLPDYLASAGQNEPILRIKLGHRQSTEQFVTEIISSNLRKIVAKLAKNDGGCAEFMNSSAEQLNFEEDGRQQNNITIACYDEKLPEIEGGQFQNFTFCKNGTECVSPKIKWSKCAVTLMLPGNGENLAANGIIESQGDQMEAKNCTDTIASIQIIFNKEREPDMRPRFYQRRGRFHCPSDVTCLAEVFFTPDDSTTPFKWIVNALIAIFLIFIVDIKIDL